jgi:hypothetical protein
VAVALASWFRAHRAVTGAGGNGRSGGTGAWRQSALREGMRN